MGYWLCGTPPSACPKIDCAFMPPAPAAMPMPMKPTAAPAVLPAAVRMASACAAVRFAARIFGSRITAAFCRSLIICSSSGGMLMEFTAKLTTWMPRVDAHLSASASLSASTSSIVCAGTAE